MLQEAGHSQSRSQQDSSSADASAAEPADSKTQPTSTAPANSDSVILSKESISQMALEFPGENRAPASGAAPFSGFDFLRRVYQTGAEAASSRGERPALKRDELVSLSGVENYSAEAVQSLSKYFDRTINDREKRALAAELVFPNSEAAATLYKKKLGSGLTNSEELTLRAFGLAHGNPKAAELYKVKLTGEKDLLPIDLVTLYALDRFPSDRRSALQLRDGILKEIMPIHAGQKSAVEVNDALLAFARMELRIANTKVSSVADLGLLFKLPAESVQRTLDAGLGNQEKLIREERRLLAEESDKYVLEQVVRKGVRDFVVIENSLHQMGRIASLSTSQEIGVLFGISGAALRKATKLVGSEDLKYREETLVRSNGQLKVDALIRSVALEVEQHRRGEVSTLRDDQSLAAELEVSPVAVFRYLRESLPSEIRNYRELKLLVQPVLAFRASPVAFVKAELAAFDKGEITSLSSNVEIARMFNVDKDAIVDVLRTTGNGLSPADLKFRNYVFAQQAPRTAVEQSLRDVSLSLLVEKIEKSNREVREARGAPSPENVSPLGIKISGYRFDSLEEAALSLMTEKHIPDFALKDGVTSQVLVNQGRARFDLVLEKQGVIVEYHPERLAYKIATPSGVQNGSFKSPEEYDSFLDVKAALRGRAKKLFVEEVHKQCSNSYRRERIAQRDADPKYRGMELIVAQSPEEYYYKVIDRFNDNAASKERFLNDYRALLRDLKDAVKKNREIEAKRAA